MTIKRILVPLDGSKSASEVLETALVVANRFGGHIDAVHVLPAEKDAVPFMVDRLSANLRKTVIDEALSDAREQALAIREAFDAFCEKHGIRVTDRPESGVDVSASWSQPSGRVSAVLLPRARLSDLIVFARPDVNRAEVRRSPVGEHLEAVMLGCGRPVILVPPGWVARRVEHAAFAWNESLEATRALSMMMPYFTQVSSLVVVASEKRADSVTELREYLRWHGVECDVAYLDKKGDSVGDSILQVCRERGTEIVVVGGFSHARARQLLFGGVTRHLLMRSEILTAMVH